jgi:hypothetical protein
MFPSVTGPWIEKQAFFRPDSRLDENSQLALKV